MRIIIVMLGLVLAGLVALVLMRDEPAPPSPVADDPEDEVARPVGPLPAPPVEFVPPPDVAADVETPGPVEGLAETIEALISDLITGKSTDDDRAGLAERLRATIVAEKLADPVTAENAAKSMIDTVLTEARRARKLGEGTSGGQLATFQSLAVRSIADQLAQKLRSGLAAGGGTIHEGTFLTASLDVDLPEGYQKAAWRALGGFEYKEGMKLPKAARDLHRKKVGIAGYMMSLGEFEDIHEFLLVESQWSCCYGVPPDVHQVVVVTIPDEDEGLELLTVPVIVLGTLDVGEEVEDGWVTSVYRLKADVVETIE